MPNSSKNLNSSHTLSKESSTHSSYDDSRFAKPVSEQEDKVLDQDVEHDHKQDLPRSSRSKHYTPHLETSEQEMIEDLEELPTFRRFGIVGAPRNVNSYETHRCIFNHLSSQGCQTYVDEDLRYQLPLLPPEIFKSKEFLAKNVDLVIVIGGDGNFLHSTIFFSPYGIPLVGVNKGNLGFLAEIDPDEIVEALEKLLSPRKPYYLEERLLLEARYLNQNTCDYEAVTICNELTIKGSNSNQIIEVEVYIDQKFGFSMRGDGLIIATPTGSTAHNVSAGGPIVNSAVEAVILTPISAHNLTTRPVVIPGNSEIEIHFKDLSSTESINLFNDGILIETPLGNNIISVGASHNKLKIVHFDSYNYYRVLAKKLNWARRLF